MHFSIATTVALAASVSARSVSPLVTREKLDLGAACSSMYAQEGDCHLIITTSLSVTLSGSPAPGGKVPTPGVGWSAGTPGAHLLDHDCNLLESNPWENGKGWEVQFIETDKHDYIHAFEHGLGPDNIEEPAMSSGAANPVTPICDGMQKHSDELDGGWYRVCVFPCSGGRQIVQ